MHTIYFFKSRAAQPSSRLAGGAWPAAYKTRQVGAVAENQAWHDVLAQHQAIYEELLASPEWASPHERTAPSQPPLSARELTRDLAGWGRPDQVRCERTNP